MNDRDRQRLQRRVIARFAHWRARLGLAHWRDTITFFDRYRDDDPDGEIVMDTSTSWQYRRYVVRVYAPAVASLSDDDFERVIVHELVHVLLDRIARGQDRDLVEAVTTDIEIALTGGYE